MCLEKRLKKISINLYMTILILAVLTACEEKKVSPNIVAKVDNKVLTETELKKDLSEKINKKKFREEFIRQWIEQEVMFLEASKQRLLTDSSYNRIIEKSKIELAAALLEQNFFKKNKINYTINDLKRFFLKRKDNYRLNDAAYLLNAAEFNNEDNAVNFRFLAMDSNWKNAFKIYGSEKSITKKIDNKLLFEYQVQPKKLLRVVKSLDIGETSIVFQTEPNKFAVVQLLKKLKRNEIPPFNFVKNQVKERYLLLKARLMFKRYLNNLYKSYNVQILR